MPRLVRHAKCYFRHVRCPHRKADCISEVVALCWKWWTRLVERQKDPNSFISTLASFSARAVRSGRRVCGQLKARDAMSERAQQRHGFTVNKLPDFSTLNTNPLADALCETPDHNPARIAAFKIDFPSWRRSQSRRNRRLIDDMMVGNRTKELAMKHRLSPARVSQLRRELHTDWRLFTGDEQDAA
ncbi:MAG: hypothetical protein JNM56_40055 [Planctomycetia bacterium]|nr:hypothetical protein [Planctomycetia bacterium]